MRTDRHSTLRVRQGLAAAAALAAAVALGGCQGGSAVAAGPTSAPTSSTPTVVPTETPSGTATRPPDAVVTAVAPVKRPGAKPVADRIKAKSVTFGQTATYSDGLTARVVAIKQGTSTGEGPGVFVGAPQTALTLEITNGSTKAIALNQVVVSMTYGKPGRLASPVYDQASRDLTGTLAPGSKAVAVYQFSVPVKDLDHVVMTVDIDGLHSVATFTGSARR